VRKVEGLLNKNYLCFTTQVDSLVAQISWSVYVEDGNSVLMLQPGKPYCLYRKCLSAWTESV